MFASEAASFAAAADHRHLVRRHGLRRRLRAVVHVIIATIRLRKVVPRLKANDDKTDMGGADDFIDHDYYARGSHLITPNYYYDDSGLRYELDNVQRVFVTFEYQDASILSQVVFYVLILAIILGVVLFILAGDPQFNITPDKCDEPACDNDDTLCPGQVICQPQPPRVFDTIDEVCVIVFTIDYLLRVLTCWSVPVALAGVKVQSVMAQRSAIIRVALYILRPANLIDICAILPFYVGLGLPSGGGGSSSFVRVLRLARLLRILKLGKNSKIIHVLTAAISLSIPALVFFIFFMGLGTIVCASILYIVEMGTFKVTADCPDGVYLRPTLLGDGEEVSPYKSIAVSLYYTIITQTTVGYGDIYPTSEGGRAMACIAAFSGILVLALPVSIVGTNFQLEYEKYVEQLEKEAKEAEEAATMRAASNSLNKIPSSKSVRNILVATSSRQQIEHTGPGPAVRDDPGACDVGTKGLDIIPEPRPGVAAPAYGGLVSAGVDVHQPHKAESEGMQHTNANQAKQPNKMQSDLLKAVKKCRLAVTQNKDKDQMESSRKLRKAIVEKLMKRSASLKAAALPLVAPQNYLYTFVREEVMIKREYSLSLPGRIFMTLEDGSSSLVGQIISLVMLAVIVLSVICYIMSSIAPDFVVQLSQCSYPVCDHNSELCPDTVVCEPTSLAVFDGIDQATVIIFTVEYFSRLFLCWAVPARLAGLLSDTWDEDEEAAAEEEKRTPRTDPEPSSWYHQIFRYLTTANSGIDIVAILPFYVGLGLGGQGVSLSFVRVLRLARVLRLLKMMKGNEGIGVMASTMVNSKPALVIMGFLVTLTVIFFGSIIYITEQGTFTVNSDYPSGAFLRPTVVGDSMVESTFVSIASGIYWAVVTTSTLGYGDLYATSVAGRAITCVTAYLGLLVVALPIGVVGGNFSIEYQKLLKKREKKKADEVSTLLTEELSARGLPLEEEELIDPHDAMEELVECYRRYSRQSH